MSKSRFTTGATLSATPFQTGTPVCINKNPICPQCKGKLRRDQTLKGKDYQTESYLYFKCDQCDQRFKTKRRIVKGAHSIKIYPDRGIPWITKAMTPIAKELYEKLSSDYDPDNKGTATLVWRLMNSDLMKYINVPSWHQDEMRTQIDEAIKMHLSQDEINEILRFVFYAAVLYDNTHYNKLIEAVEQETETIESDLQKTRVKAKRKK